MGGVSRPTKGPAALSCPFEPSSALSRGNDRVCMEQGSGEGRRSPLQIRWQFECGPLYFDSYTLRIAGSHPAQQRLMAVPLQDAHHKVEMTALHGKLLIICHSLAVWLVESHCLKGFTNSLVHAAMHLRPLYKCILYPMYSSSTSTYLMQESYTPHPARPKPRFKTPRLNAQPRSFSSSRVLPIIHHAKRNCTQKPP